MKLSDKEKTEFPKKRSPSKARKRLRRSSPKKSGLAEARRQFVAEQLTKKPMCEARVAGCQGRSTDIHEKQTRARGGDILDEKNTMSLCRNCHRWIHDNPLAATKLGYLMSATRSSKIVKRPYE